MSSAVSELRFPFCLEVSSWSHHVTDVELLYGKVAAHFEASADVEDVKAAAIAGKVLAHGIFSPSMKQSSLLQGLGPGIKACH